MEAASDLIIQRLFLPTNTDDMQHVCSPSCVLFVKNTRNIYRNNGNRERTLNADKNEQTLGGTV